MLLNKFKKIVLRYGLFTPGDNVLIAFSGGPDSVCLLDLLMEVSREWDLGLSLAHFNHKLREDADEDEWFSQEVAEKTELPVFIGSEDVYTYAKTHRMNLEEAGRRLRYGFLEKTALETGCDCVATGHNMTDQAETFFMRLMRGSGRSGLTGIYPFVEGLIVRPLLEIEREEIDDYLEKRGLDYRLDQTNYDRRFFRNKIRLDLLPYLRDNFDPGIIPRVSRLVLLLQEEETVLEELTEEAFEKAIRQENGDLKLDFKVLLTMPRGLARRVVRKAIQEFKGDLRGINFEDIENLMLLGEGKEIYIQGGLAFRRELNLLFLKQDEPEKMDFEYAWDGKKDLEIYEVEFIFTGKKRSISREKDESFTKKITEADDRIEAYLNFEKLKFPLSVRNRKEGDRYRPLGSPGRKKVKEMMRERGIPLRERDRLPVFLSGNDIVWIVGHPVNEDYKVNHDTRNIFEIKLVSRPE